MSCPRRHMCWQSKRLHKGAPGGEQEGRAPWRTAPPPGSRCRICGDGLVSRLSPADRLDSGSFLVAHASLCGDEFQSKGFWEVSRTTRGPCLLPPLGLSQILPAGLPGHTLFLIGTSFCETTRACGYCAWPRRVVLVNGFLTEVAKQRIKNNGWGTSLVVQWLSLGAPNVGGPRFHPLSGN